MHPLAYSRVMATVTALPLFHLYGDPPDDQAFDFIQVEPLVSRSSAHDWKIPAHRHRVLLIRGRFSEGGTFKVPAGHYLMMGDNRDDSLDGRYDAVGFVPEGNLVGRATGIWMNWGWPSEGGPQWNRIGKGID